MFGSSRHCSLILIAFIASPFGLQRRQSITRQTIYRGPVFEMARRQFDGVAALAIALEELMGRTALAGRVAFLEELPRSPWDPGVLLPEATLQVSFLKDLLTHRKPTSPYTFVNFLKETGRLDDFVNLRTPFPYRIDFALYIEWVANQVWELTCRGQAVTRVIAVEGDGGAIVRPKVRRGTLQCAQQTAGASVRHITIEFGASARS
ncbi:SidA/IucD/PvdA family monooxygenase [Bradyrhizobium sp. OAE829]|uniref:SidA/IucD/PvdA family monooxygenase n=1 Tax=Bradyrhizobium sp. OAE829 TaxID=2663807 RepID=UPI0019F40480